MTMRFACPTCQAVMNAPDGKAGVKVTCPKCGQRLQIPAPPKGTILAKPLPPKRQSSAGRTAPAGKTPDWLADISRLGQFPPVPSDPAAAATYNAEPESTHVYDNARPPSKWMGRVVLLAILLGLIAAAGWVSLWAFQRIVNPGIMGNEKQLVLDYLQKNLNDPTGMEVVEWGPAKAVGVRERQPEGEESDDSKGLRDLARPWVDGKPPPPVKRPKRPLKPAVVIYARYRAKNGFGAKTMTESMFLIQNGKVVDSAQFDKQLVQFSHDSAVLDAIVHLCIDGFDVESVDGKDFKYP
jgi:hypothetical protein